MLISRFIPISAGGVGGVRGQGGHGVAVGANGPVEQPAVAGDLELPDQGVAQIGQVDITVGGTRRGECERVAEHRDRLGQPGRLAAPHAILGERIAQVG